MTAHNDGSHAYRSCLSKHKYATETHAQEVATHRSSKKLRLCVYACKLCGCWHLATVRGRKAAG